MFNVEKNRHTFSKMGQLMRIYREVKLSIVYFLLCFCVVSIAQQQIEEPENQTMSLDVKDSDIRDVIRMISRGYGLNIILDNDVVGKVTLHLTDVPIIEGLNTLAGSNGWELMKEGSVYRIRKPVAEEKSSIQYTRGKLTVDVQNVAVLDFIKELSSKTAVSIVPDSKIDGKVSGKLYHVPLEDGLKAILEGNGFRVTKRRNIYQVSSEEEGSDVPNQRARRLFRSRRSSSGKSFFVECADGFLTVEVINANLEDVINEIAEQSEAEIIIYGNLSGMVNAKLNQIPLTEGLALLLGGTKFTFVQKDNVILIGDRNTATPSGQTLSKSELVHLKHIKADEVPKILPKNIPATNVKVIKEQNALLISGTSEDIVATREFLSTIDIPTPQVVIDVIVVEYSRDIDKDFGFQFEGNVGDDKGKIPHNNYFSFPEVQVNRTGSKAKKALRYIFGDAAFIDNLPTDFHMTLRLLESQSKAKVLAQPSITVLNGNKAKIDVGQTQYFKVIGGTQENPTENFRPINFGISLNITPWISQGGQITAEISPEISNSMGTNEQGYPNVFRRSVTTTVRIDDGKTLVLGGLLRSDEQMSHYKVPVLGDIPILGYLFKTTRKKKVQTNLVIYITPRVIKKDGFVDLNEELKKFDLRERRNSFKRSFSDDIESIIQQNNDYNADQIEKQDSVAVIPEEDGRTQKSDENKKIKPVTNFFPDTAMIADSLSPDTPYSVNDSMNIELQNRTNDRSVRTQRTLPFPHLQEVKDTIHNEQ